MFEVGQKVYLVNCSRIVSCGKVVRITDKRKDVVVDFGGKTACTFESNGFSKGYFSSSRIIAANALGL